MKQTAREVLDQIVLEVVYINQAYGYQLQLDGINDPTHAMLGCTIRIQTDSRTVVAMYLLRDVENCVEIAAYGADNMHLLDPRNVSWTRYEPETLSVKEHLLASIKAVLGETPDANHTVH